jgi:hypothetical protein
MRRQRRRRAPEGRRLAVAAARPMIGSFPCEDRFVAQPTCHRSPDEALHEFSSKSLADRRRGEPIVRALRRSPRCTDQIFDRLGPLCVSGGKFAGMSSSPIVSPEGAAIGVVSVGSEIDGVASADMQGPNSRLSETFRAGFWRSCEESMRTRDGIFLAGCDLNPLNPPG